MRTPARHRLDTARGHSRLIRWTLRAALASTAASLGLVATGAVLTPAAADAPLKVGWWTQGGGTPASGPDTKAGGMRVAVAPQGGIVSYGAIEYAMPESGSGTITLSITAGTPTPPTPPDPVPVSAPPLGSILACPTLTADWKAGDAQDLASGPKYDCNTFFYVGALSSDGKTMTFQVDGAADVVPGTLSLAIIPSRTTAVYDVGTDAGTDATPPYYVSFDAPGPSSLAVDNSSYAGPPTDNPPPPASSGGGAPSGTGSTTPTGSGPSTVPLPSTTTTGTTDTGQTPVVAGSQTGSTAGSYAPQALTKPASNEDRRDLLLVLLILVLFGILYTQNATAGRQPRALAGPRAAPVDAGDAAAAGAGAAAGGAMAAYLPFLPARGLGRFAKPRTRAARPLI